MVPGTIVGTQNFVQIGLSGKGATRALTITCIDKDGATRFTETVLAKDLAPKSKP